MLLMTFVFADGVNSKFPGGKDTFSLMSISLIFVLFLLMCLSVMFSKPLMVFTSRASLLA